MLNWEAEIKGKEIETKTFGICASTKMLLPFSDL